MNDKFSPLKSTSELSKALNEAEQREKKVNKTTTLDLVSNINNGIGVEIVNIVKNMVKICL